MTRTHIRVINFIVGLIFIASSAADVAVASRGSAWMDLFYVNGLIMLFVALGPIRTAFKDDGKP